ncbi:hypothetical protein V5O48_012788 [Marasmius crinis-equi]|uniref:[histone H3]-trimethyl-L-lysine(9) demethylase n=1 Tax=Marasmius crinis-equi TaxID=585013 RepID=A0ABR3F1V8_9AGAR
MSVSEGHASPNYGDRESTRQGDYKGSGSTPRHRPQESQREDVFKPAVGRQCDGVHDDAYGCIHDDLQLHHPQGSTPSLRYHESHSGNGRGDIGPQHDSGFQESASTSYPNDHHHLYASPIRSSGLYRVRDLDSYDTVNRGNYNQTYNDSLVRNRHNTDKRSYKGAVVYVSVNEGERGHEAERVYEAERFTSSGSTSSSQSSTSSIAPNPGSSLGTSPSLSPSIPIPLFESARAKEMTESQRYESLLLGCRLGYPLWEPSPRCTPDGEYLLNIGDVGVFCDGLPFYTFFNITQPSDSTANRDGIPEGVDPPCVIQPRWLTVKEKYHEKQRTFFQPKGAISQQRVQDRDGSRVFTFDLSHKEGALLALPQGGTLTNLQRTEEFKGRVKRYWRQWFNFADDQSDLDDHQALYVLTGVERCSTWAIAVWDSMSSHACENPGSLELSIDQSSGSFSWSLPPARCVTQSYNIPPSSEDNELKQSVFVRGFWINRSDGKIGSGPPPMRSGGPGGENKDEGDTDSDRHRGNYKHLRSSSHPHGSSTSNTPPTSQPASKHGHSESSGSPVELRVEDLDLCISDDHPCQIINRFALVLISKARPALLDAGCVAFSHDDDWMSIVKESDSEFPTKIEIVRRVCSQFKFVVGEDSVSPESMLDIEKLVQCSLSSAENGRVVALVDFLQPVPSRTNAPKAASIDWQSAVVPVPFDIPGSEINSGDGDGGGGGRTEVPSGHIHLPPGHFKGINPADLETIDGLIIDIRSHAAYASARIPTAISLSASATLLKSSSFTLDQLGATLPSLDAKERFGEWQQAKKIIVYDDGNSDGGPNETFAEGSSILALLRKFADDNLQGRYAGELCWLRGGFQRVWREQRHLVDTEPLRDKGDEEDISIVSALKDFGSDSGVLCIGADKAGDGDRLLPNASEPIRRPHDSRSTPSPPPNIPPQPDHFYDGAPIHATPDSQGKTWLDPDDDRLATRGIPVFKPTMEEFRDFEAYMLRIERWGMYSGIVKVIPPKEWKDSLPPLKEQLNNVQIRAPIEQHMLGQAGLFRQQNFEKRKTMSVREWAELCALDEYRAPGIDEVGLHARANVKAKPRRTRKSATSKAKTTEPEMEGQVPVEELVDDGAVGMHKYGTRIGAIDTTPKGDKQKPMKQAKEAKLVERAEKDHNFLETFDPHTHWLPPNMKPEDYTPEFCAKLERQFWRHCGWGKPPWYGTDTQGSLFTDETTEWNVAHLESELSRLLPLEGRLPGVTTPYLYWGMWRATFAWHVEDMDLFSIDYMHFGAPKFWYAVPQGRASALEHAMRGFFPKDPTVCHQFMRHKSFLASPTLLAKSSCKPNHCVQHSGEFIITYPRGYHAGFNLGFNCVESVNFALASWLELGKVAKACECIPDSVRIDVNRLLEDRDRHNREQASGSNSNTSKSKREWVSAVAKPISMTSANVVKQEEVAVDIPPLSKVALGKRESEGSFEDFPKPKRPRFGSWVRDVSSVSSSSQPESTIKIMPPKITLKLGPRPAEPEVFPCCLCISMSKESLLRVHDPPVNRKDAVEACGYSRDWVWMAHRDCARIVPETWVDEIKETKEEVVFGVEGIIKDRWSLKCAACTKARPKAHGAPIQCTRGKCVKAFHISCARDVQDNNVVFNIVKEAEKEDVLVNSADTSASTEPAVSYVQGLGSSQDQMQVDSQVTHPASSGNGMVVDGENQDPTSDTDVLKVIKKYEVQLLCPQHNPAVAARKKASKQD